MATNDKQATLNGGDHLAHVHSNAFSTGGTHTRGGIDVSQPGFPIYHRKFGNPGPLGLFSFASTTLILSLFNVNARHIATPNLIVSMAIGVGGLVQLLAGMWEFAAGNTFGATAFSSYGGSGFPSPSSSGHLPVSSPLIPLPMSSTVLLEST